jgi:hypothetical protein
LGSFPVFSQKRIRNKDLGQVYEPNKRPAHHDPDVPVMGVSYFMDFIDHREKKTPDHKNNKVLKNPFFLADSLLRMLKELMLLRIECGLLFLFKKHPNAYL